MAAGLLFAASVSTRLTDSAVSSGSQLETSAEPSQSATLTPTTSPQPLPPPEDENPAAPVATFREGLVGRVQRLNPLLASLNPVDQDITSLIFEGLTRLNQFGEPVPALALDWVISSDGLEYVVRLREDVLWQDGTPFTAADVALTMALLRAPDFPGEAELAAFWRTVETEELGPHLVRFRLTQPLGSFLDKLRIGIVPHHALAGTTAAQLATHPFNLSPVGTGPYQLEALRVKDGKINRVDLRAAPVYRQRPEGQHGFDMSRVSFLLYDTFDDALSALRQGDIDGLAGQNRNERGPLLSAARAHNLQVYTALHPTLGVIVFNWQRDSAAFFREQRVRLALEVGINRSSAIERWLLNSAVQADSPLLPGSWAYDANIIWPAYDPVLARSLLDTANIPANSDDSAASGGEPLPYLLRFDILTPDDPALVNMLNEFAAQWGQLNVGVSVTPASAEAYRTRLETGDFDAALVELSLSGSADPDVYAFWHVGQYPDGLNYGGVDDRLIAETLERARRDPSGINRAIHYKDFQRLFVERAIALPLYYPLFTYVVSERVSGVQLGFVGASQDRFLTLQNWWCIQ
ncbi:MAG: ABC transporter substrate-binding protein [Aggregatilineales bacterium]